MDKQFSVLITGHASGIGKAVSDYFLSKGHSVYGIDIKRAQECDGLTQYTASVTDENAMGEI